MTVYPECVRCGLSHSAVDEDGVCITCKTLAMNGTIAEFGEVARPLLPESTERTERSGANPHGDRDRTVRSDTERSPNRDRTERPELAQNGDILAVHDDLMTSLGLVGERHISRATYLVHISRLLEDPARMVVKGDSSTGKSFAVECGLAAAAPEELYVRTSTSPLAMFYTDRDFRNTTICFYEANKLGDDDDDLARVLRTLISEGRLAHEVTVVEKRTSELVEKEGPVAFISTTCKASPDKEIETRILSMHSNNSDEQTTLVVKKYLEGAAGVPPDPDVHDGSNSTAGWLTASRTAWCCRGRRRWRASS